MGQARFWAARIAPQEVQLHECNFETWVHMVSARVPVKATSETPEQCASMPMVEGVQEQCQHGATWDSHSAWAHPKVNIPRGAILSRFSPIGCPAILSALGTDQNHSEETEWGLFSTNQGAYPTPDRAVTTIELRGKLPWISRGGFCLIQQSKPKSRG